MLMVIFGAGASFDSVPSRPPATHPNLEHRLPLAAELFADRPLFTQSMRRFPDFTPLVPFLRNPPSNLSVEGLLQQFQAERADYPVRHQQLAAIRFYLHFVIWACEMEWKEQVAKGITNYVTLLDQVERWRGRGGGYKRVCLVTFNYDTLLEDALPFVSHQVTAIDDYISSDNYKVVKVHGSRNWARDVMTAIPDIEQKNTWQAAQDLIARAQDLVLADTYRIVTEWPIGKHGQLPSFPALAIPVEAKADFVCPASHVTALKEAIPQVTKILVVGWRGVEAHAVELLKGLKQPSGISGVVVAGNYAAANDVTARLEAQGLNVTWRPSHAGFSEWTTNGESVRFLRG